MRDTFVTYQLQLTNQNNLEMKSILASLFAFLFFTHIVIAQQCGLNGVIINEVLYNPTDDPGCENEYVELCNTNDHPADLSKCVISDCDGSNGFTFVFPTNAIIPANGYAIIYNSHESITAGTCETMGDILICNIGNTSDQLGNVGEHIVFWDGYNYCEVGYGTAVNSTAPERDLGCIGINTGNQVGFEFAMDDISGNASVGRDPDSMSDWVPTGCSPGTGNALPIVLSAFDAKDIDGDVMLTWTTSSEINSSHFSVEWGTDGRSFSGLEQIEAEGNSTQNINYRYIHSNPSTGVNFYRLKQVDLDGSYEYSEVKSIRLSLDTDGGVIVYPTAVEQMLNIEVPTVDGEMSIEIVDLGGNSIFNSTLVPTELVETVDMGQYASGMYIIRVNYNNTISSQRIFKK